MLWETDGAGLRYRSVTGGAADLLGLPLTAWIAPGFWESRLHPDDREAAVAARRAAAAQGREHVLEYRLLAADGRPVWIRDAAFPRARGMRGVLLDVTAQKRAQEHLDAYREIFERSADGIAIIDEAGRYVEQNAAHRALVGYEDEELIGATPALHLGEEAFARIAAQLQATGLSRGEHASRTKSGRVRIIDLSAFTIRAEDGRVLCHVGVKRDVTERHEREAHIRFQADLLDAVGEAVVATDAAGTITYWNRGAERTYGWPAAAIVGRAMLDLVAPPERERAHALLRRIAAGESWEGELPLVRADGSIFAGEATIAPVRDASGAVVGTVGVSKDVSETKRAAATIHRRLEELKGIYRLSDAVARATTLEEVLEAALDSLERALGVRRAAVLLSDPAGSMRFRAWRGLSAAYRRAVDGHSPWPPGARDPAPLLVPDALASPEWAAYRDVFRAEGVRALAFIPLVNQGRLLGKFMLYHAEPHDFTAEEVAVARTVASHIAFGVARKRAEEELEVARRQIAVSEKLAALGSLVSGVAHEVRTPLTYLSNNLFVVRHRLDRVAKEPGGADLVAGLLPHMEAAIEGVDRINRLVTDLRPFGRLKGGRSLASLDEVVRGAVDLFQATHRGELTLEHDLAPTAPLDLDREQVQQIVLNLLENAADAVARGGRVRVATREADGGAVLEVEDDGTGIPQDVRERMFDPFFTTKADGTGLGLSIVRRIVDAHEGTIRVESEPGRGSRFEVFLPRRTG